MSSLCDLFTVLPAVCVASLWIMFLLFDVSSCWINVCFPKLTRWLCAGSLGVITCMWRFAATIVDEDRRIATRQLLDGGAKPRPRRFPDYPRPHARTFSLAHRHGGDDLRRVLRVPLNVSAIKPTVIKPGWWRVDLRGRTKIEERRKSKGGNTPRQEMKIVELAGYPKNVYCGVSPCEKIWLRFFFYDSVISCRESRFAQFLELRMHLFFFSN